MTYDVIVVGAGVVGALTARELARYDLKVLVVEAEADASMGATKANSAIVHGGFAETPGTLKARFGVEGRRLFPALEAELNFGYRVTGSLVAAFGDDRHRLHSLADQGRRNGVTDLEVWSPAQTFEREPNLSREVTGALWCPGAGVCNPWDLAYAALENAVAHGVEFRPSTPIEAVEAPAPGLWRLTSGPQTFEARFVVNAAGLGAASLDRLAGVPSDLTARTGEYLVLAPEAGGLVSSVIFQLPGPLGKGILVGPTYQGNLLVGPDAKNEGLDAAADLRSTHLDRLAHLWAQAQRVVNGLDPRLAIRSFTGVRAVAPGGDFVVGQAVADGRPVAGWHRALGIQSPGLTASPALARHLVAGLAAEGLVLAPRAGFDPGRRPLAVHLSLRAPLVPFARADALTRLPPGDPDRVVCRCEQVTEAHLADACSRGLPVTTVDALKRRTRAGMGRCQGRFCRPRVAQWLSDRLGTPVPAADDPARSGLSRVEGRGLWTLAPEAVSSGQETP